VRMEAYFRGYSGRLSQWPPTASCGICTMCRWKTGMVADIPSPQHGNLSKLIPNFRWSTGMAVQRKRPAPPIYLLARRLSPPQLRVARTMTTPFFSIGIPTKGRSFLVGGAIESALRQTFPDLEVICGRQ